MISVRWITDVLTIFPPRILLWTEAKEQTCFASCTQLAFLSVLSQCSVICSPFAHFTMRVHARYCSSASDEKTWPQGLDVLRGDRNNELKMWCGRNQQVWWKSYEWGDNRAGEGMATLPVVWGSGCCTCTSLVDPSTFGDWGYVFLSEYEGQVCLNLFSEFSV